MISIDLDFSARAMAAPFLHDDLRPETINKLSKAYATVSSEGTVTTILTLGNYLKPLSETCENFIEKRR